MYRFLISLSSSNTYDKGIQHNMTGWWNGWQAGSVEVVKQSVAMCIGRYSEERKLCFEDKQPIISTPHHTIHSCHVTPI